MRIVYFAWVRERLGCDGETVEVPASVVTAGDLATWLGARGGEYAAVFGDMSRLRIAVDQAMATPDTPITGATEVAFFPPVTGGVTGG